MPPTLSVPLALLCSVAGNAAEYARLPKLAASGCKWIRCLFEFVVSGGVLNMRKCMSDVLCVLVSPLEASVNAAARES